MNGARRRKPRSISLLLTSKLEIITRILNFVFADCPFRIGSAAPFLTMYEYAVRSRLSCRKIPIDTF